MNTITTGSIPGNDAAEGTSVSAPDLHLRRAEGPAISWPAVVLGSVIVVSGLGCYCLLVLHGVAPSVAVQDVLLIAGALVVLVLPASSLGAVARGALRALSAAAKEAAGR